MKMNTGENVSNINDKNCAICDGNLLEKSIPYTHVVEGSVVIVENVPTLVCSRCGHEYLSRATAVGIEEALAKKHNAKKTTVSVYQFPA